MSDDTDLEQYARRVAENIHNGNISDGIELLLDAGEPKQAVSVAMLVVAMLIEMDGSQTLEQVVELMLRLVDRWDTS